MPADHDTAVWEAHEATNDRRKRPAPYADGELSVTDIADRLQVSTGAVYYWISNGQFTARRGRGNRLCVTWDNDVEAACRRRTPRPRISNPTRPGRRGSMKPPSRRTLLGSAGG